MKKQKTEYTLYLKNKQLRKQKAEKIKVAKFKRKKNKEKSKLHGLSSVIMKCHLDRAKFRRKFYSSRTYKDPKKVVCIEGDLGLESKKGIDEFLNKSLEIVDFTNRELIFNLKKCTRMWPSALTLLCSLKQWVELSTRKRKFKPRLASTNSLCNEVNSYLHHSGFYDYVGRDADDCLEGYNNDEIVKIRREKKTSNIEEREVEIIDILSRYTKYNKDEIRLFYATVLIESFLNVSEHGVSGYDNGWWVLAQYHPTTGLISINIADNGIGIKNSLITGPQRNVVLKQFPKNEFNDGQVIKYATDIKVSGALKASLKEKAGLFSSAKYPLGSNRGNGLDRIKSGCKQLGIEFTLLSHYGYLFYDALGNELKCGTMKNRIFAGTLYHFNVPALKG